MGRPRRIPTRRFFQPTLKRPSTDLLCVLVRIARTISGVIVSAPTLVSRGVQLFIGGVWLSLSFSFYQAVYLCLVIHHG